MKKRVMKVLLIFMMIICISGTCTACGGGKLSGTYVSKDSSEVISKFVFQGNRVTVVDLGVQVRCSYKLEDDRLIINGTTTFLGTEIAVDYDYAFEKKGDSIYLDGKEYVKQ